jgi:hypothetical protein
MAWQYGIQSDQKLVGAEMGGSLLDEATRQALKGAATVLTVATDDHSVRSRDGPNYTTLAEEVKGEISSEVAESTVTYSIQLRTLLGASSSPSLGTIGAQS